MTQVAKNHVALQKKHIPPSLNNDRMTPVQQKLVRAIVAAYKHGCDFDEICRRCCPFGHEVSTRTKLWRAYRHFVAMVVNKIESVRANANKPKGRLSEGQMQRLGKMAFQVASERENQ